MKKKQEKVKCHDKLLNHGSSWTTLWCGCKIVK